MIDFIWFDGCNPCKCYWTQHPNIIYLPRLGPFQLHYFSSLFGYSQPKTSAEGLIYPPKVHRCVSLFFLFKPESTSVMLFTVKMFIYVFFNRFQGMLLYGLLLYPLNIYSCGNDLMKELWQVHNIYDKILNGLLLKIDFWRKLSMCCLLVLDCRLLWLKIDAFFIFVYFWLMFSSVSRRLSDGLKFSL